MANARNIAFKLVEEWQPDADLEWGLEFDCVFCGTETEISGRNQVQTPTPVEGHDRSLHCRLEPEFGDEPAVMTGTAIACQGVVHWWANTLLPLKDCENTAAQIIQLWWRFVRHRPKGVTAV